MQGLSTDTAMFGVILLGAALCVASFWVEIRRRRHEKLREATRTRAFIHNQARSPNALEAADPKSAANDAQGAVPEAIAANGP